VKIPAFIFQNPILARRHANHFQVNSQEKYLRQVLDTPTLFSSPVQLQAVNACQCGEKVPAATESGSNCKRITLEKACLMKTFQLASRVFCLQTSRAEVKQYFCFPSEMFSF
jgi:hypothetical protein